jgi:hypothetical protein
VGWSPDGTFLRAALPVNGLLTPGVTLWHIPANGEPAYVLGTLTNGSSVSYAPDLGHIAFFTRPAGESNIKEMYIARGDGTQAGAYVTGRDLRWLGWAPDSRRFVYALDGAAYLGEIGADPRPLFADMPTILQPRWVSDDQLIFLSGEQAAWELRQAAPGGTSSLLVSLTGDMGQFDFSR